MEQPGGTHGGETHAARVLVVDDDRDWSEATVLALDEAGFEADAVYDGPSAISRLEAEPYDAAIIDVQMPGPQGDQVVRELREKQGIDIPILIATGMNVATGVCAGLIAGADEEFFKFESSEIMVHKLRKLLKARAH